MLKSILDKVKVSVCQVGERVILMVRGDKEDVEIFYNMIYNYSNIKSNLMSECDKFYYFFMDSFDDMVKTISTILECHEEKEDMKKEAEEIAFAFPLEKFYV